MTCDKCGRTNRDDARFCGSCGNKLRTRRTAPVCPSCHFDNALDSRFCANCGAEFFAAGSGDDRWVCDVCGFENPPESHYCKSCGARLEQHRTDRPLRPEQVRSSKPSKYIQNAREVSTKRSWKKNQSSKRILGLRPAVVTLVFIAGGLVLLFSIQSLTKKEEPRPVQLTEAKSNDPVLEAKVREIASKFICSCGKCGEQSLDVCSCNTAIEERQVIRNYLQLGQSPEQVIAAVKNNYSWMKAEFSSRYDSSAQTSRIARKLSVPEGFDSPLPDLASGNQAFASRIATQADRADILSHFRCPCGQCGTKELKDCECSHPRGSKEVKAFVDSKIAEGKYTVPKVVDEVERKYGGRKS